jgi:uncharacterized protein YbcI
MLSQRIQALYRNQLGHQTGKITCELFDDKLAIVVENSVTQPEQLLLEDGKDHLAEQIRLGLDDAIRPKLQALLEEVLNVSILDLLSDATPETGRTGVIAILATPPHVRAPLTASKLEKK